MSTAFPLYGPDPENVPPQAAFGAPPGAGYPYAYGPQPVVYQSDKSKVVAAVLAWFLGGIGVHDFYLGQNRFGYYHLSAAIGGVVLYLCGAAVAALGISLELTALTVLGVLVGAVGLMTLAANQIWQIVEFILILVGKPGGRYSVDGLGRPLR